MKTRNILQCLLVTLGWVAAVLDLHGSQIVEFTVADSGPGSPPTVGTMSLTYYDSNINEWVITLTCSKGSTFGTAGAPDIGSCAKWSQLGAYGDDSPAIGASPQSFEVYPLGTDIFSVGNVNLTKTEPVTIPGPPDSFEKEKQSRLKVGLDPIQLASGAEVRQKGLFILKGARDWEFDLSYNSLLASMQSTHVPMGLGWSHNFQTSIAASGSDLVVSWNQASANHFSPSEDDPDVFTCSQDGGLYDTIVAQSGGGWLLTHRDQSTLLFNASGQLVVDTDPHGRALDLTYSSGQLTGIADPVSSTSITLAYNSNGYLQSVIDGTSAQFQLAYALKNGQWVLTQVTDPNSHTTTYAYDEGNNLATVFDNVGAQIISNTYDTSGRVVSQVDGLSHTSLLSYTIVNHVPTTTVTDRNGNTKVYTFDSSYNEESETDALGETTTFVQDLSNQLLSVADPLNRTTSYTYDQAGNIVTITDPAGKVTTKSYDSQNNLLRVTDPLGQVTTYTYDSNNNLLSLEDALGHTTTWTYNANSQPLSMTLPRGGVYSYAYTAGYLTQITDPNGVVTSFGYDGDGRLLYSQDALSNRSTFTYDAAGNRLTGKNPLNQTFTYAYDYRDRATSVTDPTGAMTSYTYDTNGNLLTTTDALSHVTTYSYTPEDQLHTVMDTLSRVTTLAYDNADRLLSVTDPAGNVTAGTYDAASQLVSTVDAMGNSTTFAYELRGLPTTVADPLGRSTAISYDGRGRRIAIRDPLGRQTNFAYDAVNRMTQTTDPASLAVSLTYDGDGNASALSNAAGDTTNFSHDQGDRPTGTTTPAGHGTSYSYDVRGLPLSVTQPSSHATTLIYDNAGRVSSSTDLAGTIALTRDAVGRILTISEAGNTLTRVYDGLGNVTSYTDGVGNVFGYQYDSLSRLILLTYPGGKQVAYAYDSAGRLSTVTDWAARVTSYTYDSNGRMTQILRPNGTKQVRTYDVAGQLIQLNDFAPDGTTIIYSATYWYDMAGQLTAAALNPATTAVTPNITQTFDQDDRLVTQNGTAVSMDADGNLLSIASGVTPSNYTYDARNRLTSAGGLTYGYNSENRRISVTDSTGETQIAVNPNASLDQVLVRTAPDGTQTFYVYGLGLLHEETGGVPRFYHFDQRGDTVALSTGTGTVTANLAYGVYGEIVSQTGSASTPFLFNGNWGVQTDSNGLYFHRARYYHPTLRRWLNADPLGLAGGLNLYAYVGSNPIKGIDPTGTTISVVTQGNVPAGSLSYFMATGYTSGASIRAAADIQRLQGSSTNYTIIVTNDRSNQNIDSYDPSNHTVTWDPTQMLLNGDRSTGSFIPNGEGLSPATILAHEMDHAADDDANPILHEMRANIPDAEFDNQEEARDITGVEYELANALGEGVRLNHDGQLAPATSVFDFPASGNHCP